ncbi:4_t:CDS:2, partial [Racocetra fulgida]
ESSESLREQKNHLAREACAQRIANETIEEAEQQLRRRKQTEAKRQVTNVACVDTYDT